MPSAQAPQGDTPSFVIYVDESGDEGFKFGQGSTDWFVISALIVRKREDPAIVGIVDEIRASLELHPRKHLHFKDMKHRHRIPYLNMIASRNCRAISVLVHKPSIREPDTFSERYRLYFYATRILLERASWCCRDAYRARQDAGNGTAETVFSNRSGMSYEELREYLHLLRSRTDVTIDWSVLDPDRISTYSAGKRMGLQLADAVAGGFLQGLEPHHGFTENRYVRILRPVLYCYRGRLRRYGIKIWPERAEQVCRDTPHLEWITRLT